ncbi:MAG: aminoacetone oxidase family FAD-binding enzyme [Bacteroidales bacterium]|nr:aminoacetone oxidase family FAD-binding enzyme [Bacteroidales bacterium]
MKHIIVIGAGPAGMLAAGTAAEQGARVTLIEKMHKPGRKLAITGKGRCNLTNVKDWEDFSVHVHPVNRYFKPAFYGFTSEDTVRFFNGIGLPTVLERGSRVYPASGRAFDVIDVLVRWLEGLGVRLIYATRVTGWVMDAEAPSRIKAVQVTRNKNAIPGGPVGVSTPGSSLGVSTSGSSAGIGARGSGANGLFAEAGEAGEEWEIKADHFILATGGMSYPGTGSTGDGYGFAQAAGHTIVPVFPALTALMPLHYDKRLTGVKLKNVALQLMVNGQCKQEEEGELFFTDLGIEGPIGFRVSRRAVTALNNGEKVELHLNLKPAVGQEQLMERWQRTLQAKLRGPMQAGSAMQAKLRGFMPRELVDPFSKYVTESGMHPVEAMQQWAFPITSYEGWRRAVVTAGGISMKEVNPKTMRSRLVGNLSFAGEVLDLDADSGGYNLQVAFATGRLAGKSAI